MTKNVDIIQKESIRKDVSFDKQQVTRVTLVKQDGEVILSGKVRVFSDKHEYEGERNVSLTISEYEDEEEKIIPAMTVKEALDNLEIYQGVKPDLTKLKIDDFLASIVHENLA